MSQQGRDFSSDGFVSGIELANGASARLATKGVLPGGVLPGGEPKAVSPKAGARSCVPFVPPHDLAAPRTNRAPSFKKLDSGRVAIANIDSKEFEPGWGSETKPHSQREIFLNKQAFADGKKAGELEAREIALEEGKREGREGGYREGFVAGSKERAGDVEGRAQEIANERDDKRVGTIAHFLSQLLDVESAAAKRRDTELMTLMIAIFDKTLPALTAANGEEEVTLFLTSILKRFEDIPQITITLSQQSQDLISRLRGQVDDLLPSDKSIDTMLSFRFDDNFGASDCRIAWAEGEVERRFEELWGEVKYALERHLPKRQEIQEIVESLNTSLPDDAELTSLSDEPVAQASEQTSEQASSEQTSSGDTTESMALSMASSMASRDEASTFKQDKTQGQDAKQDAKQDTRQDAGQDR